MLLKIVQVGDPVLRQVGRELTVEEIRSEWIQDLIRLMHETLRDAPGVGLAAPQIGESLQLAIIEDLPEYSRNLTSEQMAERERTPVPFHVIINPKLTGIGQPEVEFFEGCLSLNGFTGMVPRFRQVRVECLDEQGKPKVIEASGWYSRILQHEIDHLNATIYIDRMFSRTFMSIDNATKHWKDTSAEEVKHRLRLATSDVE